MKKVSALFTTMLISASGPLFAMAQRPQDPGAPPPPMWMNLVPFAVMIAVFYFLLIRPQMRQRKEKDSMLGNLKRGDRVVTSGGIIATIVNTGATTLEVKLNEETKVKILKSAVVETYSEASEPVKETAGTAS